MRFSIIGLGWLGVPLARFFMEKGHRVQGTTTTAEKADRLNAEGIPTFPVKFDPDTEGKDLNGFFDCDVLIITIPPARGPQGEDTSYPLKIGSVRSLAEKAGVRKMIFISATSVYPDLNQVARESDPLTAAQSGHPTLLKAEEVLWDRKPYSLTVIRLGGLLGVDRVPGKWFSNKSDVVGHAPVNYIHREDAISLIDWVISRQLWDETFNGVSPLHPPRGEVYEHNARLLGFASPLGYESPPKSAWKEISSEKIVSTGFSFKYEDPFKFQYE